MPIPVEHDTNRRMTQPRSDHLGMLPLGDKQRHMDMTQVVRRRRPSRSSGRFGDGGGDPLARHPDLNRSAVAAFELQPTPEAWQALDRARRLAA